ncbi:MULTISPECIES: hypothetical protein [unclassified Streptomyces]|uniref:hypothetical protein n=1 Tax=unclassified Streptomyces TaxID=2593676 RepID=UPI002DDB8970|nr:hypothetical protein [Streptomyces sp. NBC_01750]WSB02856.1 hypothetical protein OIE54_28445 [Streptomyces sp. NBC_01794]WSD32872.1 hypothetical protein OG966_13680 [Streptomyces sp. NBC_01750]
MKPHRKSRSSPAPSPGLSRPVQGGLTVAAFVLIPVLAIGGSDSFRATLDFTTGVLSLVSLTASVAWGLIATDRLLLSTRHRLLSQAIHRSTAVASLGFLLLHATVKVSLGHVELLGALVPFGLGVTGTSGLIGFGSLAGFLMVVAATTGALRSALATNIRVAGRWRPLHMLAYPAWCSALVHGLYTGRPAATWVVTMYCLSLTGVAAAVSLRMLPQPVKRRIADKILSLIGSGSDRSAADERLQRDLASSPLPGATGLTGPAGLNEMNGRGAMNGIPSQRAYEQDFQRQPPLGQPRTQPRRLEAPAPQLYEVPMPPEPEPTVSSGTGPGPGISAAYRAVSLAPETAPLAERVPMTEEIPVVSDSGPMPGQWPTPSPPPPAQAVPSAPPIPPAYEPPPAYAPPAYEPAPAYDTPLGYAAPSSFDASPSYDTPSYDTPPYEPPPAYDTPPAYDPSSPYEAPSSLYDTSNARTYDDTAQMPGPLFPPPAGEPWHAPAGDRP